MRNGWALRSTIARQMRINIFGILEMAKPLIKEIQNIIMRHQASIPLPYILEKDVIGLR